jgi:GNAT superfamily N-acetyltransferase
MSEIVLREAAGPEEIGWVRGLIRDYAAYLSQNPSGAGAICIAGYDEELRSLPGPYAAPGGTLLIALRDGKPIGCCALKPIRVKFALALEDACEMKRLWVDPEARGLRLGRRLVESAIEWARGAGYTSLYLDTAPAAMPEAEKIYRTLGFEEIGRFNDNPVAGLAFFRLQL